ncbi:hypothetical protein BZA05DRAFT_461378 [Tricharina praecox]|uniref:uncharacterized protein n=1 Tax=Tricharina praecox TaxID=43433 RepID=UPI00221F32F3|nr:uncharacterized protein BZA05DRAFT_461378 [Tricharina praecox]KAI5843778.1 hypothetical protein BZA05DRAFT_461378 [Tricharina praecox]
MTPPHTQKTARKAKPRTNPDQQFVDQDSHESLIRSGTAESGSFTTENASINTVTTPSSAPALQMSGSFTTKDESIKTVPNSSTAPAVHRESLILSGSAAMRWLYNQECVVQYRRESLCRLGGSVIKLLEEEAVGEGEGQGGGVARRDEEIADGEVREDDEHTKVLVAEHIRQKYACLALAEQESARKHEEHTQALVAEHLRQKHAQRAYQAAAARLAAMLPEHLQMDTGSNATAAHYDAPIDREEVNRRIVAERMAALQPDEGSVVRTVVVAALVVAVGVWLW